MLFPVARAKILEDWRLHVRAVQQSRLQSTSSSAPTTVSSSNSSHIDPGSQPDPATDKKKLPKVVAIIDSITSMPGVSLPWVEMVQILREECGGGGNDANVWCVIDAAHSIGQEVCSHWLSSFLSVSFPNGGTRSTSRTKSPWLHPIFSLLIVINGFSQSGVVPFCMFLSGINMSLRRLSLPRLCIYPWERERMEETVLRECLLVSKPSSLF